MKKVERDEAIKLRRQGYSLGEIKTKLQVSKGSVSRWVRNVELTDAQRQLLSQKPYYKEAVEKRRQARLASEKAKRDLVINTAQKSIGRISKKQLWLIGVMLYWAEGGKTQTTVRFSNGDPNMIKIMMVFFREICEVPERKFRAHIHIHPHLDHIQAEKYWSTVSGINQSQFYKTYRKPNKSSQSKKNSLPYGTFDIYVMDTQLFYKIQGWAKGIFSSY